MNKPGHILVLTYWSYADALIQTYTLPYIRIIKKQVAPESRLILVTLEKTERALSPDQKKKVKEELGKEGIIWMPKRYKPFGFGAAWSWSLFLVYLTFVILRRRVSFIHCWATPAGAAGYVLSLFTGRKLIIDSYEPHAESMVENGTWKKDGIAF